MSRIEKPNSETQAPAAAVPLGNQRSQAAIERIGAKFEGILRTHRMAADSIPRDSFRYSILASEWPDVKRRLTEKLLPL